jgi:hypothetical protein
MHASVGHVVVIVTFAGRLLLFFIDSGFVQQQLQDCHWAENDCTPVAAMLREDHGIAYLHLLNRA